MTAEETRSELQTLRHEAKENAELEDDLKSQLRPFWARERSLEHAIRTTYPHLEGEPDWNGNPAAFVTAWSPPTIARKALRMELDRLHDKYAVAKADYKECKRMRKWYRGAIARLTGKLDAQLKDEKHHNVQPKML